MPGARNRPLHAGRSLDVRLDYGPIAWGLRYRMGHVLRERSGRDCGAPWGGRVSVYLRQTIKPSFARMDNGGSSAPCRAPAHRCEKLDAAGVPAGPAMNHVEVLSDPHRLFFLRIQGIFRLL